MRFARRKSTALLVIAKEPVAGRSKTRLCPPCTPTEAAELAEAALRDTLEAVAAARAERRVLVLDGVPGPWLPPGFHVIPQREGGLADRLAGAFADVALPAFLVGMDTPQLTPELIDESVALLEEPDVDAVLGQADDGGYWSIGLKAATDGVFRGIPMSSAETYRAQRRRLDELQMRTAELSVLTDVDTIEDAHAVAAQDPNKYFARAVSALGAPAGPRFAPADARQRAQAL